MTLELSVFVLADQAHAWRLGSCLCAGIPQYTRGGCAVLGVSHARSPHWNTWRETQIGWVWCQNPRLKGIV